MDTGSLVAHARSQSLGDVPRRSAERAPHKVALVDGEVRLTFGELEDAVDRTAAALHAQGLGKGERLALLSHNCWQFAVLSFATARLGVVLVPVNFMLGADEIAYILDHSEASAFVAEDALVPVAEQAIAASQGSVRVRAAIALAGSGVPEGWQNVARWVDHDGAAPDVHVDDDDTVRPGAPPGA